MRNWLAFLLLAFTLQAPALAQLPRNLPKDAKVGVVIGQQQVFPMVQINDKVLRLAPGGLIYDQHNRTIVHGALPPEATVLYNLNNAGDVTRIIILRPEEELALQQAGNL
jgi:hypothetical protein